MKPTGYQFLTIEEIQNIERLRNREYTINQIVALSGRSHSTVKRIIYKWPSQAKVL